MAKNVIYVAFLAAAAGLACEDSTPAIDPGATTDPAATTTGTDPASDDTDTGSGEASTSDTDDVDVDVRPVVLADPAPPPIMGGRILLHSDDNTLVVSDPDRDLLHVVDLDALVERDTIVLDRGAQPWRSVEDRDGRVHVVLRGSGQVATLDVEQAAVLRLRSVCTNPRGIALGADGETLWVACAGGELVRLPVGSGAAEHVTEIDRDLRDVFVDDTGLLHVTRFRAAEVLTLADDGGILERVGVSSWGAAAGGGARMRPNSAWQTLPLPGGGWFMVHQGSSDASLIEAGPKRLPSPPPYYGGEDPCTAIVQSSATIARPGQRRVTLGGFDRVALPVDAALSPDGSTALVVGAGESARLVEVDITPPNHSTACHSIRDVELYVHDPGPQLIAVTYAPDDRIVVQQREPAMLLVVEPRTSVVGPETQVRQIPLSGPSIAHTGDQLFHEVASAGLACASCHPEGGDDGLVWQLESARHTPALYVGLAGTAPFHWTGDLADFTALVREVLERRMGALFQPAPRAAALEVWVTGLRTPPPNDPERADVEVGRALFSSYGCASCHVGDTTTNNETVRVGDGPPLQVPPLHGIGLHPPYMHDARALTLEDAVRDMIEATQPIVIAPSEADVAAIVEYLDTL